MQKLDLKVIGNISAPDMAPMDGEEGVSGSLPQSWYPVCRSRDLKKGRVKLVEQFAGQWIMYRNDDGQAVVVSRYCCHMGVDLQCARVVGDNLVCPLHQWEFDTEGVCTRIPAGDPIPKAARQQTLPCIEKYGIVFVFWGDDDCFDIPAFPGLQSPMFDKVRLIGLGAPYESITLNGFDSYHFEYIHNRKILGEPALASDQHHHLAIDFVTKVKLRRWPDYVSRLLGFTTFDMRLDCWGGNLIIVSNKSTGFRALLALAPVDDNNCKVYFVGAMEQKGGNIGKRIAKRLYLWATSVLGKHFLDPDKPVITGMRPKPGVLLKDSDRCAIRFWQYWKALPRKSVAKQKRQML
ncbi:MAG: Rieske 2Fe-2S domain-containing protein [Gammaproteobacteria bacterium]|jgi:nitrite reductase/ring-hydroxylating ferredoxin subunit